MPRKPRLTAEEIARMPKQIPLVIEPDVQPNTDERRPERATQLKGDESCRENRA